MRVFWGTREPLTSQQIIDALAERENWHPKTVRTLITRLSKKGALGFRREGRGYRYRARVTQQACVRAVSRSFLDRVFDGSLRPMLAHFVQDKRLSKREIAELKRLLEEKE